MFYLFIFQIGEELDTLRYIHFDKQINGNTRIENVHMFVYYGGAAPKGF